MAPLVFPSKSHCRDMILTQFCVMDDIVYRSRESQWTK